MAHHSGHALVQCMEGSHVLRHLNLLHLFRDGCQRTDQRTVSSRCGLPRPACQEPCGEPDPTQLRRRVNPLDFFYDVVWRLFGGEHPVVKHGLKRGRGSLGLPALLAFEPRDEQTGLVTQLVHKLFRGTF